MGYAHMAYAGAGSILLSMSWLLQKPTIIRQHLRPQELLKDPRGAREGALQDPDGLSEA